jgi:hypothetical protein
VFGLRAAARKPLKYIVVVGSVVWLHILSDYFNNCNFSKLKQYAP